MNDIVVIGAGPAGLTAAYEATGQGARVTVLERLDQVGGLARTVARDGCLFDMGPHRFFTKNNEVHRFFVDIVGADVLRVPRLTRILYGQKYFDYPLTPVNAALGIGPVNAAAIIMSYAAAKIRGAFVLREPENFTEWISAHFGTKLFEIFFKTYTEKVWGIPCDRIGADWAAQRIKGLNLWTAIRQALRKDRHASIKTLVDEFLFPRLGAGQPYEKLAAIVRARGAEVRLSCRIVQIRRDGFRARAVVVSDGTGRKDEVEGAYFMSSAPITEFLEMVDPPPPVDVLAACRALRYRDHIGVDLTVKGIPFRDNWIYVHARHVKMARITNYRNFSVEMAASEHVSPLTIEYFTFKGDDIWNRSEEELVSLATDELHQVGILRPSDILSGFVVRNEKAYPVIERGTETHIATIKGWLDRFENLAMIGRSGMFKYNNQDHAIATGFLAARTALGLGRYDPWLVNIDAEYLESGVTR